MGVWLHLCAGLVQLVDGTSIIPGLNGYMLAEFFSVNPIGHLKGLTLDNFLG